MLNSEDYLAVLHCIEELHRCRSRRFSATHDRSLQPPHGGEGRAGCWHADAAHSCLSFLPEALAIYDADGDGVLNKAERAAARKAMVAARLLPSRPLPTVLLPYDLDGDGVLSETEAAAVQAAIDDGTVVLPEKRDRHPGEHRPLP